MDKKYLDEKGLKQLWGRVMKEIGTKDAYLSQKIDGLSGGLEELVSEIVEKDSLIEELQDIVYGSDTLIDSTEVLYRKTMALTQEEYDALEPEDDVVYYIVDL